GLASLRLAAEFDQLIDGGHLGEKPRCLLQLGGNQTAPAQTAGAKEGGIIGIARGLSTMLYAPAPFRACSTLCPVRGAVSASGPARRRPVRRRRRGRGGGGPGRGRCRSA